MYSTMSNVAVNVVQTQITEWLQEVATETEVEDTTLAKAFVTTLLCLTQHSTAGLDNVCC
jgi:hypothetical protein